MTVPVLYNYFHALQETGLTALFLVAITKLKKVHLDIFEKLLRYGAASEISLSSNVTINIHDVAILLNKGVLIEKHQLVCILKMV